MRFQEKQNSNKNKIENKQIEDKKAQGKDESENETEDTSDDSNSENKNQTEELQNKCKELKKKLNHEKGKNELALKIIKQSEKDEKKLEAEKLNKEQEHYCFDDCASSEPTMFLIVLFWFQSIFYK